MLMEILVEMHSCEELVGKIWVFYLKVFWNCLWTMM